MQSSLVSKIEKANRYAQEPERVTFQDFHVTFRGDNDSHTTWLKDGRLYCTCNFFQGWGRCAHTMALEKILNKMLPDEALTTQFETAQ
jgi:predicted nucleic acid-binding Zn finger protein